MGKSLFKYGRHPVVLLVLSLASGLFFYFFAGAKPQFEDVKPRFQLSQSPVFKKLVECTEFNDGVECFKQYRGKLGDDSRGLSARAKTHLDTCLDVVGSNAHDVALLLNIQTCYHQADVLDRAVEFNQTTRAGTSWGMIAGLILNVFIQLLISVHLLVNYLVQSKSEEVVDNKFKIVFDSIGSLNQKTADLDGSVAHQRSETRYLSARLNSGDVKKDISNTIYNLNNLVTQFNYLKSYIYNEQQQQQQQQQQFAILPTPSPQTSVAPAAPAAPSPKSPSFDITCTAGRTQLKNYLKSKSSNCNSGPTSTKENVEELPQLRYNEIKKYGPDNQKFKRVFIPRRGWVAMRRFEEEAALYGGDSYIKGLVNSASS